MNIKYLLPLGVAVALAACGKKDETPVTAETPAAATSGPPLAATVSVKLAPTQGHTANGALTFLDEGDALRISGTLSGLTPSSEFGFHVHEKGDCSAPDASSAGGHFNPTNSEHGNPQGATHHAGDIINAKSDLEGVAKVDFVSTSLGLASDQPNDVHGKAVVLHEKADDYATQPSGNSGARIACGVIQ
jgi:superoxide dismutase, Cu-Zn family